MHTDTDMVLCILRRVLEAQQQRHKHLLALKSKVDEGTNATAKEQSVLSKAVDELSRLQASVESIHLELTPPVTPPVTPPDPIRDPTPPEPSSLIVSTRMALAPAAWTPSSPLAEGSRTTRARARSRA